MIDLGYDKMEFLTVDMMKNLYLKIFFKKEVKEPEEIEFYNKEAEIVLKAIPENAPLAEVRNYFEIQFLMKYVKEQVEVTPTEDGQQNETTQFKEDI